MPRLRPRVARLRTGRYDFSTRYDWDNCGACCEGHLIVEAYDLDVLREPHLVSAGIGQWTRGMSYDAIMADLEQEGKCILIAGSKPCKFLTEGKKCAIYPTHSNVCVAMQAGDEQCQRARGAAGL